MAFVARRPFTFLGIEYEIGDVITGYPEQAGPRAESFVRAGLVTEQADLPQPTPRKRKAVTRKKLEHGLMEQVFPEEIGA